MADCSRLARRQPGKLGRRTSTAAYGAQPETVTRPNADDVEPRSLPSGRCRRRGTTALHPANTCRREGRAYSQSVRQWTTTECSYSGKQSMMLASRYAHRRSEKHSSQQPQVAAKLTLVSNQSVSKTISIRRWFTKSHKHRTCISSCCVVCTLSRVH